LHDAQLSIKLQEYVQQQTQGVLDDIAPRDI